MPLIRYRYGVRENKTGGVMEAINASQLATAVLSQMNGELAKSFDADVIFIKSPMRAPLDSLFRIEIETIKSGVPKRGKDKGNDRLCILLGSGPNNRIPNLLGI